MRKKLYFGHPMNTYDTPLETRLLTVIKKAFPGWGIENPNQEHHQQGCRESMAATGNPMRYFFETVLPDCDAGIFLPFRDGKWGAGIFGEAMVLLDQECPIWRITPDEVITKLPCLDGNLELTVDETLSRICVTWGDWLPY